MENQIKECVEKYVGRKKVIPIFWIVEESGFVLPPMKVNFGFKTINGKEITIYYKSPDPNDEKFWMGLAKLVDESKRCATLRMHSSDGESIEEWQLFEVKAENISFGDLGGSECIDVDLGLCFESIVHVSFNSNSSSETTGISHTSNQLPSTNGNQFHKFLVNEDVVQ